MSIIDFHCDTASSIFQNQQSLYQNTGHIDLERLKIADYRAQWFAFFVNIKKLNNQSPMEAFRVMYNYFKKEVDHHSHLIEIVTTYEAYRSCQQNQKIAALLSLEEGEILEGKLDHLNELVASGIRLMTLTWNYENAIGYPHHINKGLKPFGEELLQALNDTPILIDLSHLSESALPQIKALYHKPIIASHSNGRDFYPHTRNASNEVIRAIAESGGVIGLNFYNYFLSDQPITTISLLLDALSQLINVAGVDTVVLGTDFDGIDCELEVCNCAEMDKLITSMYKIFPSTVVDKVCFGNAERLLRENF